MKNEKHEGYPTFSSENWNVISALLVRRVNGLSYGLRSDNEAQDIVDKTVFSSTQSAILLCMHNIVPVNGSWYYNEFYFSSPGWKRNVVCEKK